MVLFGFAAQGQTSLDVNLEGVATRLWGRTNHGPLKVGCFGDSVGYRMYEALLPTLRSTFGASGSLNAHDWSAIGMWTGSNAVTGGCSWDGGAKRVDTYTTNWFAIHYTVPAGGSVTWTNRGAADARVFADRATVSYIAGDGYGAFKVLISTNAAQWVDLAVVEANAGSRRGAYTNILMPLCAHKLKVIGLTGTNVILNVGLWDSTSSGLRTTELFNGDINISQITNLPAAILTPVLTNLDLDILLWEMKDCHGDLTTNRFAEVWPAFEAILRNSFPNTLVVLLGTTPQRDNNHLLVWQNDFVRSRAIANGWVYWDGYSPFVSYENALSKSWFDDVPGIHPSPSGSSVRAATFWSAVKSAAQRSVKLESPRANGGGRLIRASGLPGIRLALQASTNLTTWENLGTNTFSGNVIEFEDNGAVPTRYYRCLALSPP